MRDDALEDARLLVTELVTNSLKHSDGDGDQILLEVDAGANGLRVEVTDGGDGFNVPDRKPGVWSEDGRGLMLVDRLADSWGIDTDHGTRVWFELRCVPDPAPPA